MVGVLKSILRWIAYLPLWQSSSHIAEPAWPSPSRDAMHAVVASASLDIVQPQRLGSVDERLDAITRSIRDVPICILWTQNWAGELGRSMLFHAKQISPDKISVGYFAYWSTERPWGDNGLTRWVLPAVAIDALYSHVLFVLPGIRQLMYGAGDVEGVRVTYRIESSGRLSPIAAIANDASHNEVALELSDLLDEQGRVLVYTAWWSHQLGGKGALAVAKAGAMQRCFVGDALRVVTPEVSGAFRLGGVQDPRRARPAWRLTEVVPS